MIITITDRTLTPARRRDVRRWLRANGVLASAIAQPVSLDTDGQAIQVNATVPVAGQEDADFPEMVTDDDNRPVTRELRVPLVVSPPGWVLDECA